MQLSAVSIVRVDEGREFIYRKLQRRAYRAFNKQFIRLIRELKAVWRDTFPPFFKLSDYLITDETQVALEEAIQRGKVTLPPNHICLAGLAVDGVSKKDCKICSMEYIPERIDADDDG